MLSNRLRKLLNFKTIVLLFILPMLVIRLVPHEFRGALTGSFANAELSIVFWYLHHSIALGWIFLIAFACGSYNLFFYYCLLGWLKKIYREQLKEPYVSFTDWATQSEFCPTSTKNILSKARTIGQWVFNKVMPGPKDLSLQNPARLSKELDRLHMRILIQLGVTPGTIFQGAAYAHRFEVNLLKGYFFESFGNALKIGSIGFVTIWLADQIAWSARHPLYFAFGLFTIVPMAHFIRKRLTKFARQYAPDPEIEKIPS